MKLEWLNIVYFTNINILSQNILSEYRWASYDVRGKNVRNKKITYLI